MRLRAEREQEGEGERIPIKVSYRILSWGGNRMVAG